jgi:hypothetical protein
LASRRRVAAAGVPHDKPLSKNRNEMSAPARFLRFHLCGASEKRK